MLTNVFIVVMMVMCPLGNIQNKVCFQYAPRITGIPENHPGNLQNKVCFQYAPRVTGIPENHPTSRGRAALPPLTHAAALGVPGGRRGSAAKLSKKAAS